MKKLIFALIIIFSVSANAQGARDANPSDVATIDGVMNAYYEAVSGPPGKRDINRILSLYAPGAKLNVSIQNGVPIHGTVEDVVQTEQFQNITTNFYEQEITRDEHRFGNLANVISTYGISDSIDNFDFTARGITIFQMYYAGDRWWIMSSIFQREAENLPLPYHLL